MHADQMLRVRSCMNECGGIILKTNEGIAGQSMSTIKEC